MENATTFRKDDREAAGSRFASADELHISHDQTAGDSSIVKSTCYTVVVRDTCSGRDSISYT
ncbi:hypothetical protein Scep_014611 [Stephania cephalantha]|uniref:Uncharacterized protein n=1 Tax=Stephania cephalantha TaxID=152367 RepID=A0AAP0J2B6_9MAGN